MHDEEKISLNHTEGSPSNHPLAIPVYNSVAPGASPAILSYANLLEKH